MIFVNFRIIFFQRNFATGWAFNTPNYSWAVSGHADLFMLAVIASEAWQSSALIHRVFLDCPKGLR